MSHTTEKQRSTTAAEPTAPAPEVPARIEEARPSEPTATPVRRAAGMALVGRFLKKPPVGGTIAGAITLGLAATLGVLEAAVAGGVAYGVYAVLRKKSEKTSEKK